MDLPPKYDKNATFYFASDCELSNDPPSNGNFDLGICNRTQYFCPPSSGSSNSPLEIEVPFEYQVHMNSQSNTRRVLLYLEENMLEHLASYMGLTNCQASRRKLASFEYVGIDTSPPDIVTNKSCGNVDDVNTRCVSVQGGVTVFPKRQVLSDEEKRAITNDVVSHVESSMDRDIFVIPGVIEKVYYLNRTTEPASSTEDIAAAESGVPKIYIGLIVGLGIPLLIILAILLCFCRRRRCCCCCRKKRKEKERTIPLDESKVIPNMEGEPDSAKQRVGEPLAEYDSLALQQHESEDLLSVHGSLSMIKAKNQKDGLYFKMQQEEEEGDDKSMNTSVNTSHTSMISLTPPRKQPCSSDNDSLLLSESDEEVIVIQNVESGHQSTQEVSEVFSMDYATVPTVSFISPAASEISQTLPVDDIVHDDFVTTEDIIADLQTNESGLERPPSPHSLCTRISQATTLLAGTNRRHDDDSLLQLSSIEYDTKNEIPRQIDEVDEHLGRSIREASTINIQKDDNLYGNNSYFDNLPENDGSESGSDDTDATPRRRLQMG